MTTFVKLLAGAAGLAAIGAAAPAAAQYPYGYAANPYGYRASPYGSQYAYGGVNTTMATQQCAAAVQSRLYNRTSLGSILGSLVGVPQTTGRVVSFTSVTPRSR